MWRPERGAEIGREHPSHASALGAHKVVQPVDGVPALEHLARGAVLKLHRSHLGPCGPLEPRLPRRSVRAMVRTVAMACSVTEAGTPVTRRV